MMPHLVLEYSADLAETHDISELIDDLFATACGHAVFANNLKAVKARSIACDNARSGGSPQNFAHLTVRLLAGRSKEAKANLAETLLEILDRHLPDVGSLSVEPIDMDPDVYRKRTL